MDRICDLTKRILKEWEDPWGWAPNSAAEKICNAMTPWMIELTECLRIWAGKWPTLTDGELILAKANLGSLIESWLKFVYCIYYEDYLLEPLTKNRGSRVIPPEEIGFLKLEEYSRGRLWEEGDEWDTWVDKMRNQRNAIHSFTIKEIGTSTEFFEDCGKYYDFLELIISRLPESPEYARNHYL